jgi:hypothetical protein
MQIYRFFTIILISTYHIISFINVDIIKFILHNLRLQFRTKKLIITNYSRKRSV